MRYDRAGVLAYLEALGIATTTVDHPAVFTVEESDRLCPALPGGHTKNLFLKDAKGGLWLVIAEAHGQVDLKALSIDLGAPRFSFGKADLLAEVLGVTPGSVTALAVVNDRPPRVQVVVDARLMVYETINCHPLENTATTAIGRDDLIRFLEATGHPPRVARLPDRVIATAPPARNLETM
jgi:Ala-tRNA(Pro) deacylase